MTMASKMLVIQISVSFNSYLTKPAGENNLTEVFCSFEHIRPIKVWIYLYSGLASNKGI